jgi:hypothetical protein
MAKCDDVACGDDGCWQCDPEASLNPEGNPWNAVEELDRLLQAADGLKSGSLTFPGMWHYAEIARCALESIRNHPGSMKHGRK